MAPSPRRTKAFPKPASLFLINTRIDRFQFWCTNVPQKVKLNWPTKLWKVPSVLDWTGVSLGQKGEHQSALTANFAFCCTQGTVNCLFLSAGFFWWWGFASEGPDSRFLTGSDCRHLSAIWCRPRDTSHRVLQPGQLPKNLHGVAHLGRIPEMDESLRACPEPSCSVLWRFHFRFRFQRN